jgi:hypothetical protein
MRCVAAPFLIVEESNRSTASALARAIVRAATLQRGSQELEAGGATAARSLHAFRSDMLYAGRQHLPPMAFDSAEDVRQHLPPMAFDSAADTVLLDCVFQAKRLTLSFLWYTRRFVLCKDGTLHRYDGEQLRHSAAITSTTSVATLGDVEFTVTFLQPDLRYHIRAASRVERDGWVNALLDAITKNTGRFVLCKDGTLQRYDGERLCHSAAITSTTSVATLGDVEFTVTFLQPDLRYHIRAASRVERDGWVNALLDAITFKFFIANRAHYQSTFSLRPAALGRCLIAGEVAGWFRRAAIHGHADAQFNLGCMFDDGQGVAQDRAEAARWYRMAAAQGHTVAAEALRRFGA